ncbi:MAG TPA: flavodoxin domain-containing protein [Candidatus Nanoarchaeia archaeon]|nr:flavodoxin domain-containing protein [Candidatus Nanoarchaeia archaeon]
MAKALIVYGTRTGTTANTSEVIAETLRQVGCEVKIVDAKKERVQSLSEFDLIIVGSGIQMGKWTSEPENFIKKHQKELATKRVALFVSCGGANPLSEGEKRTKEYNNGKQKYLQDKATEFGLKPIALGYFGGCYNFGKMSWFFKKTLSSIKPQLESAGYKESSNGYDLRNLDEIRNWAKELANIGK